jgi:hypothetical protein
MKVVKILLSVGIVIMMIPGLVIEPGPVSEAAGLASLLGIWGLDSDE